MCVLRAGPQGTISQHLASCREVEQERGSRGGGVITCCSHKSKEEAWRPPPPSPLAEEVGVHVDTAGRGGWVALGHNSKIVEVDTQRTF